MGFHLDSGGINDEFRLHMIRTFFLLRKPLVFVCLLPLAVQGQWVADSTVHSTVHFLRHHSIGYDQLKIACQTIGHRLTGSPQGAKAEELVLETLKKQGLESVRFDPFPVKAWTRKSCTLEIVPYKSDHYVRFEAVSLANTPSAKGIWHLVDGGDGLEADLLAKAASIKGNCLLVNLGLTNSSGERRNLHRAEKVSLAVKYGASAVLFVHPAAGNIRLTGTASLTGDQVAVPALCVSGTDGAEIRDWMKTGRLMAEMNVQNDVSETTARNVVATINASKPTRETVLFCGHLDSWDLGQGAIDNGLGAFTLIDIATAVHRQKSVLHKNVVFLWTMGEEQGLLGSKHFLEKLRLENRLRDVKAVVNLDMTGNPVGFNDFDWPSAATWFGNAGNQIKSHVTSFKGTQIHEPDLHSDHQPFMLEGIPTFAAVSELPDSVYHCYHANCDVFDLVRPEYITSSALIHSILCFQLAGKAKLPFPYMKEKKRVKWLQKHNLKEKLMISGEWRWK